MYLHTDGVEGEEKNRRKEEDQNNFRAWAWICRIYIFSKDHAFQESKNNPYYYYFFFSDGREIFVSGQMTAERTGYARRLLAPMFVCAFVGVKGTGRQASVVTLSKIVQLIL